MGKLSILGAKRVEALQVILDKQCDAEISKLHNPYPCTVKEKSRFAIQYYKKLGLNIEEIITKHNAVLKQLRNVINSSIKLPYGWRDELDAFDFWNDDMFDGECSAYKKYKAAKANIKTKYNKKKNQLWLCESLEEAKQIVGIN